MLTRRGVRSTAKSFNRGSSRACRCAVGCGKHLVAPRRFNRVMVHSASGNRMLGLGSVTSLRLKRRDCTCGNAASKRGNVSYVVFRATNSGTARMGGGVSGFLRRTQGSLPGKMRLARLVDSGSFLCTSVCRMIGALVRTVVLMVLIICIFLRSVHSALVPLINVVISLVNAFTFVTLTNFDVGLVALFTLMLIVNAIMSSTVIIIRTMRTQFSIKCGSSCVTDVSTVGNVDGTIVASSLMFVTMFVPMSFVKNASKAFCARFKLAVTITINVSTIGTLALDPTLYTLLLGPCVGRSKARGGGFTSHFHHTFGTTFSIIMSGCGNVMLFFVGHE